jgi:hypothetical protein
MATEIPWCWWQSSVIDIPFLSVTYKCLLLWAIEVAVDLCGRIFLWIPTYKIKQCGLGNEGHFSVQHHKIPC